jgi:hypothetical protein
MHGLAFSFERRALGLRYLLVAFGLLLADEWLEGIVYGCIGKKEIKTVLQFTYSACNDQMKIDSGKCLCRKVLSSHIFERMKRYGNHVVRDFHFFFRFRFRFKFLTVSYQHFLCIIPFWRLGLPIQGRRFFSTSLVHPAKTALGTIP